ncbi:MAG: tRNA (adenosine(37)-N6)-threonylcarbamoyltransferase complex transferase subunit TsaD [Chlamydiales bacterium]
MLILGIESTCDETGCSIVRDGKEILSNIVASQTDLQSLYGGVVPELACRRHIDVLIPVIDQAIQEAKVSLDDIDAIAVAKGPGLIGALLIGIQAAKGLAWAWNKPLIGVNHIEAHLYAALMTATTPVTFPCIGAVLSGGHSSLVLIKNIGHYETIGVTVDDAIGEAFDKAAKILGLPYPGGPQIEALAKEGKDTFSLRAGQVKEKPFHFSFSGLKTGVLYAAKGKGASQESPLIINEQEKKNLAASFQHAAFEDVIAKTTKAAQHYGCETILFGGGVCCNETLRKAFQETDLHCIWPPKYLCLDNAAMIAGLGYHRLALDGKDSFLLEAMTRMSF